MPKNINVKYEQSSINIIPQQGNSRFKSAEEEAEWFDEINAQEAKQVEEVSLREKGEVEADNSKAAQIKKTYSNVIVVPSVYPDKINSEGTRESQDTQDFDFTGSFVSQIFPDDAEPDRIYLVISTSGTHFKLGSLVEDDKAGRQLFKYRMAVGIAPSFTQNGESNIHLHEYSPETENNEATLTSSITIKADTSFNHEGPKSGTSVSYSESSTMTVNDFSVDVETDGDDNLEVRWSFYLSKTADNETVSNTTDPNILLEDLRSGWGNARPLPNLAKSSTLSPKCYAVYSLDKDYWLNKGSITFDVGMTLHIAALVTPSFSAHILCGSTSSTEKLTVDLSGVPRGS